MDENTTLKKGLLFNCICLKKDASLLQVAGGSIKLELVNDNWTELQGEIAGPPDTPYEGGTFLLEIKVPETYPFNPPKVIIILNIKIA